MQLASDTLEIDCTETLTRIKLFIEEYVSNAGVDGIVLGLSGGIDSSVVAALCSLAIGGNRVLGLLLPERETYSLKDINDAKFVAQKFGIQTQICDITPALKSLYATIHVFDSKEKICKGNIKARARMIYLYYYANKLNRIVCGSSDKSETMMGYFTKWGDAAADISPIMDLYKTQVRKLATHLGFPDKLANKPATPALWPGQLAETELGVKYEIIDLILSGLERYMTMKDIAHQLNVNLALVKKVRNKWLSSEHKRRTPLTVKLGYRTVGIDFRLPRSGN
jgi:NAD+ synthase